MKRFNPHFNVRAWLAAAMAALALIACGGGDDVVAINGGFQNNPTVPGAQVPREVAAAFAATLSGSQEVPTTTSTATGSGTAIVNSATREMSAVVTTFGITGTAAHIHQAQPGANGLIIFPLTETSPGSGVWTTRAILTQEQFNLMKAGGFYFNVHSTTFPNGEIRGQITAQTSATGTASSAAFLGVLSGSQEVPPTASTAQGAGTLLTTSATREVIAAVVTNGIIGTGAHIHQAAPGVNGPIIVPLNETAPGSGIWVARATLTAEQFNALQFGDLYFNVHSAALPNGEIRGQIRAHRGAADTATGVPPLSTTDMSGNEDGPSFGLAV